MMNEGRRRRGREKRREEGGHLARKRGKEVKGEERVRTGGERGREGKESG